MFVFVRCCFCVTVVCWLVYVNVNEWPVCSVQCVPHCLHNRYLLLLFYHLLEWVWRAARVYVCCSCTWNRKSIPYVQSTVDISSIITIRRTEQQIDQFRCELQTWAIKLFQAHRSTEQRTTREQQKREYEAKEKRKKNESKKTLAVPPRHSHQIVCRCLAQRKDKTRLIFIDRDNKGRRGCELKSVCVCLCMISLDGVTATTKLAVSIQKRERDRVKRCAVLHQLIFFSHEINLTKSSANISNCCRRIFFFFSLSLATFSTCMKWSGCRRLMQIISQHKRIQFN